MGCPAEETVSVTPPGPRDSSDDSGTSRSLTAVQSISLVPEAHTLPVKPFSPQGASVLISNASVISFLHVCLACLCSGVWLGRDERLCVWRNPTLWWRGLGSQLSLFSLPHERSQWFNLHNKLWKVFCRCTSGVQDINQRCPFHLISSCLDVYALHIRPIRDVFPAVNTVFNAANANLIKVAAVGANNDRFEKEMLLLGHVKMLQRRTLATFHEPISFQRI